MPPKPRVGILGCFYGCADLLPQVLEPWVALKAAGHPIVLAGINARFTEYAELGYPNDDTATRAILEAYRPQFGFLHFEPQPQAEKDARTQVLRFLLEQRVDLVWMLDGDEIYTQEQIQNILEYVRKTAQFDYYHVNFDNRAFGLRLEDDFYPPRIFRTDRRGGLGTFADDNTIEYRDGRGLFDSVPGIIPKRVAHVLHYTWRLADAQKKIRYQERHFGFSAFRLDASGRWSLNPAFYAHIRRPAPRIVEERIIAAPKAPLRVVLEMRNVSEEERRTLITMLETLLAVERQNDYAIELLVRAPEEARQSIETLFDLCPFTSRLIGDEPVTPGPGLFIVDIHDAQAGARFLLAKIRDRFPVLLG